MEELFGDVGEYTVTFKPRIGWGTFGQVYKATYKNNNSKVAVKKVSFRQGGGEKDIGLIAIAEREIKALRFLQEHENIIRLYDHTVQDNSYYLFMEYAELADLKAYLTKNSNLGLIQKLKIMQESSSAVAFMHSHNPQIIHHDIELENILMTKENGNDVVRLIDFGSAEICDNHFGGIRSLSTCVGNHAVTIECGTELYQAPELFDEDCSAYNASVDTFALGCVFAVVHELSPDHQIYLPLSGKVFIQQYYLTFFFVLEDHIFMSKYSF